MRNVRQNLDLNITASVILSSMPYADVMRPPLGVSVLLGALRRQGIRAMAIYPSLSLAGILAFDVYRWFGANVQNRFGDYFFSNLIFGHDSRREEKLKDRLRKLESQGRFPRLTGMSSASSFIENLHKLQSACDGVIEHWTDQIFRSPQVKIVACSASLVQLFAALALLKETKKRRPDIITILGGCECEGDPALEIASKFGFVDYVLSGDGDKTLPGLVKECLGGKRPCGHELPYGVFDREKAHDGMHESSVEPAENFGWPDDGDYFRAIRANRQIAGIEKITGRKIGFTTMEFSRGCWKGAASHCAFCGFNGERMVFRCKSADRILAELRSAYARGVRVFLTTDTVLDLQHVLPVLSEFRTEAPEAVFMCDTVATLAEAQLVQLADCGVLFLQVGIESLHPRHVSLLGKGNSPWKSIELLKFSAENHICVFWNLIMSIPGDNPSEYEEMAKMLPLLEHLPPPSFSLIRFDRFSEYWRNPSRYGLRLVPMECVGYLLPADESIDLMKISMHYDNANENVRTSADHSSLKACEALVRQWNDRHLAAVLRQNEDGLIEDTRLCAVDRFYNPTPEERQVLDKLRQAVRGIDLDAQLASAGIRSAKKVLDGLLKRGFVIYWDGHWISLIMHPIEIDREKKILKRREFALRLQKWEESVLRGRIAHLADGCNDVDGSGGT